MGKKASRKRREETFVWTQLIPDTMVDDEPMMQAAKNDCILEWVRQCAARDYKPIGPVKCELHSSNVQMTWTDPETGAEYPLPNYMLQVTGRVQMQPRSVVSVDG